MFARLLLHVVILVFSTTGNAGSVPDMCQGPFQLPEVINVLTTPTFDDEERISEVRITVEMISKAPLKSTWWYWRHNNKVAIHTNDGSGHLTLSTVVSDERYTFNIHLKLERSPRNLTQIISHIAFKLEANFGCNIVRISRVLPTLIELFFTDPKMPIITEMPRRRYIMDIGETIFNGKLGFSQNPNNSSPDVYCKFDLYRQAGQIHRPTSRVGASFYQSKRRFLNPSSGSSQHECTFAMPEDIEVKYASYTVDIFLGKKKDLYALDIPVELRRPRIKTPAVMVTSAKYNQVTNDYYIAARRENVHSWCIADAETKPHVSVKRITKEGKYEILQARPVEESLFLSQAVMDFTVKAPDPTVGEEEYICSATSGQENTSRRFKVIRYDRLQQQPGAE